MVIGVKAKTKGMDIEEYSKRLQPLSALKHNERKFMRSTVVQSRFKKVLGDLKMLNYNKFGLCQLNDKVYYFENDVISLPHGHPSLNDIIELCQNKSIDELYSKKLEYESLKLEDKVIVNNKTLRYYSSIIDHVLPEGITVRRKLLNNASI